MAEAYRRGTVGRTVRPRKGDGWRPSDCPCARHGRSCDRSGASGAPTARWRRAWGSAAAPSAPRCCGPARPGSIGLRSTPSATRCCRPGSTGPPTPPTHHRAVPDGAYVHAERRKPGVTLELLHLEYLERHPDGYRYTRFCDLYRRWLKRRGQSMRQVHRAGEKCFVDYAGQRPRLIDPTTGEVVEVELFVAGLGASNYTYAEATRTQQVPDWIASHARAFAVFVAATPAAASHYL